MSAIRDMAASYLAEKRAVGYKMEKAERMMARICDLHEEMGCADGELPRELVEAFCEARPGEAESNRLGRVSQIRCLGEHMARMGCDAYVVPRGRYGRHPGAYEPHIFTDAELRALFAAADALAGDDSCCQRAQAALVLRLLYSTGMRCGEACGLAKGDVDLDACVLTVRHGKNDKDRLVPLSPRVAGRMGDMRDGFLAGHPQYAAHDLFWSLPEGRPLTTDYIYQFFRSALWRAGISHGGRGKGPRVHDLRFTFACHRIRSWVREGADVNAKLPVLAAYMGHSDTRCTEYYLRLTAELYPQIVERVERECGWVVPK